ncbi:MAG: MerR family transcriptional regulator [Firmicutes bacterium]|nr:MerR family transcriptional regulator [Bacillota bacterium]
MNCNKLYRIGELAKLKGVSIQAIRHYEKYGLISPAYVDEITGYRYYSRTQFIDISRINFLKMLGFSLNEIKEFFHVSDLSSSMKIIKNKYIQFHAKLKRLNILNDRYKKTISKISSISSLLEKNKNYIDIKIVEDFYGIEEKVKKEANWHDFEKLIAKAQNKYPFYSKTGNAYSLIQKYKNDICDKFDINAMDGIIIEIEEKYKNYDYVKRYRIGRAIVTYHTGDIDTINLTLDKIRMYIRDNALTTKGIIYSKSIVNRFITNNVYNHIKELIIPIK